MNKLRQSFRRKKDVYVPEASRPHQWQTDEEGVRTGKCSFPVKVRAVMFIPLCGKELTAFWMSISSDSSKRTLHRLILSYSASKVELNE